jgi:hypothetical protein
MARRTPPPTHADILSSDDLLIWTTVRNLRQQHNGDRTAAVNAAAAQLGHTPAHIAERLTASRTALREGGVIPTMRFWITRHHNGDWTAAHGPDGCRRHLDAAAHPDTHFYPSARYAHNAIWAVTLIAHLTPDSRTAVAAALHTAADIAPTLHSRDPGTLATIDGTADGTRPAVVIGTFPDLVGIDRGHAHEHPWIGPPAHARWIADTLTRGALPDTM